eukprot:768391-Hanusia_phi.AAC.6
MSVETLLTKRASLELPDSSEFLPAAKQAIFKYLVDQIQHGTGLLKVLDHPNLSAGDVIRLMEIGVLQGFDREQYIWEQNSDGDEFGLVLTGSHPPPASPSFTRPQVALRSSTTDVKSQTSAEGR